MDLLLELNFELVQNSGHALLNDPDKLQEYYESMDDLVNKYFDN